MAFKMMGPKNKGKNKIKINAQPTKKKIVKHSKK